MAMGNSIYQWHFDPAVLLLAAAIIYLFYLLPGFKLRKNSACFLSAILLFLLVTCSPLHFLGMNYYFSAHMVAHVILLLVCGPLLVMSIPSGTSSFLSKGMLAVSFFFYKRAWLAWLAGVGIMWLWHVPAVFDASFAHMHNSFSFMPLLHSGSMLLAGMLFSWPLFGPFPKYHIHPLLGVVYLFTACISCSLLGLLITFAPAGTYHHYLEVNRSMGMGGGDPFGLSPAADQQAAGLIMWVPCCFIYLAGCIYLLYKLFSSSSIVSGNEVIQLNKSTKNNE